MKTPRAALTATAIPLLLTSLPLAAAELPFNAPDTARAQESAQLLHQAAEGLSNLPGTAALAARGQRISSLWIFPTADTDTVFAQYEVSSSEEGSPATKHLTVLKVRDNRVVEQRELTDSSAYAAVASDEHASAAPHWSASIGTGHAASTDAATSSHGVPSNPHWTAHIGTGAAASTVNATESKQPTSPQSQPAVADAHWTSRIGTGHVTVSNGRAGT